MMIVKTETSVEHKIKYLNINVSKEEIERNPDVVRLCDCDADMYAEYVKPCDDCISRQAIMDCFKKWQPYMATRLWDFEQELSALPPVSPQQRTGRWICGDDMFEYAICSECKWDSEEPWNYAKKNFDFCPNCGTKMEVEE